MDAVIKKVLTDIANDPRSHASEAAQAFKLIVEEAFPDSTDAEKLTVAETLVFAATVVTEFVNRADFLGLGMVLADDMTNLTNSMVSGSALAVENLLAE